MNELDAAKVARLRRALTAEAEELFSILMDADHDVLKSTLKNPQLTEQHLLALLKRRNLPDPLIKALHKLPLVGRSRSLLIALAGHPDTPPAVLSAILPQLLLFELVNLTQLPGTPADLKLAAERAVLKRLPEAELGNKIALARRGSPAILEALLKTGEPRLVEAVLANPKLKESGVHAFLTAPAATAETISTVARHPRWGSRPNLRFTMLRNPKTPAVWFALFLPELPDADLRALRSSTSLTKRQLEAVREECDRRLAGH
ncbi:MAG TPA: hypothetical protein VJ550_17035 [Geomonas sp.]|nr:hypothetical protein [Geomonas sp.]